MNKKILQNTRPSRGAFLRMELQSEDVFVFKYGGEPRRMEGCRDDSLLCRHERVGMRKIEKGVFRQSAKEARRLAQGDLVPTHVRELSGRGKALNARSKKAEAGDIHGLVTSGAEGLQAEADAEKRNAARDGLHQRRAQMAAIQRAHQ